MKENKTRLVEPTQTGDKDVGARSGGGQLDAARLRRWAREDDLEKQTWWQRQFSSL